MIRTLIGSLTLVAAMSATGASAPIYGTAASTTGTRTEADLVTGGNYSTKSLGIAWTITHLGGADWS